MGEGSQTILKAAMKEQPPDAKERKSGKAKRFDSAAFYAQVAENKNLGDQFLEELIQRIRKADDPPKFLFDLLSDYCHGRRKNEWKKLKKASLEETLYEELCLVLEIPELAGQWKPLGKGLSSADSFLELAISVTPGDRALLESWLRSRKHLPLVVHAARFQEYSGVFDRLMREWLLKIDRALRGDHDSSQSVSKDADRWLESIMGIKRNPRTLRNHLAPIALAYMQGEETLRTNGRLRADVSRIQGDLAAEEARVKKLEAAGDQARADIAESDQIIEQQNTRIGELESQLTAEVGLAKSSVRNAVGRRLESLRQTIIPDLEDLQTLLDRPSPNVTPCLKLLVRIQKSLEFDE